MPKEWINFIRKYLIKILSKILLRLFFLENFYPFSVQQVNQNVRLAAAVQLKNATDKNWKPRGGISAEEKAVVKDFLLKTIPLETSSVVASQA